MKKDKIIISKDTTNNYSVLKLREENASLQLEWKKRIDNEKKLYSNNILLTNNLSTVSDELSSANSTIIELRNQIDSLLKMNNELEVKNKSFVIEKKNWKQINVNNQNVIVQLRKDKENLGKQIFEWNNMIDNKITPKLHSNEIELNNLQEDVNSKSKMISDYNNTVNEWGKRLNSSIEDNHKLHNGMNLLKKQNEKLIEELNIINCRDGKIRKSLKEINESKKLVQHYRQLSNDIKNTIDTDRLKNGRFKILKKKDQIWKTPKYDYSYSNVNVYNTIDVTDSNIANSERISKRKINHGNNIIDFNDNSSDILPTYLSTHS